MGDVVETEDPEGEGRSAYFGATDGTLDGHHLLEAKKDPGSKETVYQSLIEVL